MDPEGVAIERELSEGVRHALKVLTMREEEVVRMTMAMGYGRMHSYEEVGDIFDVAQERIRRIEMKALRKLRHSAQGIRLKVFYRP
jgi:RNA polymerase primary sigma factor